MTVAAGLLPVDKPEGPTSHDVVAAARRALGVRRIGHTGTLDPFASGLLLLCLGWATRLAEYTRDLPKTYAAVARLGVVTDTDDRTGDVVRESDAWRRLLPAEIESAFLDEVGTRMQTPPAVSAKKVAGERAYRRAKRGEAVELDPVRVTIHRLEITRLLTPDIEFEVECSSGTYVRAIARDAGHRLGTGGHLRSLRRTRIGPISVGDAVPLDRLGDPRAVADAWLPPAAAVGHLPAARVDAAAAAAIAHGKAVPAPAGLPPDRDADVAVFRDSRLVAIARAAAGALRPAKVFPHD